MKQSESRIEDTQAAGNVSVSSRQSDAESFAAAFFLLTSSS
jgi:hypothetical protein